MKVLISRKVTSAATVGTTSLTVETEREGDTLSFKKGGGLIFNSGLVLEKRIASVISKQKYSEAYFHWARSAVHLPHLRRVSGDRGWGCVCMKEWKWLFLTTHYPTSCWWCEDVTNFTFSCLRVAERSLSRGRRGFSGHLSVPRSRSALLPESGPFGCGG